ncbi:hypothetical protein KUTeg_021923 [Tegillarca granosa]|uniref:Transcriptional coactivator p15 (PC4) C-terminal domain-containing protein n=1 Tax=Tegillarca granosa TaxID=220873 RepID=A0ABQ9E7R9_TEGGR|nr:hypothetical protein KUTeg_021923 [Tegillarca granosa]
MMMKTQKTELMIDETGLCDQGVASEDTDTCVNPLDLIPENKELCCFDLGDNLYIVAKKFMGKLYVHIREYGQGVNGIYPTKKGIALLQRCQRLYRKKEDYKQHLGENVYLSVQKGYACVNIRQWFLPENQTSIVPTKKEIALTFKKWNNLKGAIDLVGDVFKDQLAEVTFCEDSNDHQNQMGYLTCRRCNPNDFMNY